MPRERHAKWIAALTSLVVALLVAAAGLALLLLQARERLPDTQTLLKDPGVRAEVIDQLVQASPGLFDSHPDPEVGRVFLPGLEGREFLGQPVHTNSIGMPEREFELPKPRGRVRVVLLGDSYVFGHGAHPDERMGVFLEALLREHAGIDAEIECLHFANESWNLIAEAEFVRRQLHRLLPDLVVQLTVQNDLDDSSSVRGFGERSDFAPRHPGRTTARVTRRYPRELGFANARNFILEDCDHESRQRYEESIERVARLARACEDFLGKYLLVVNWGALGNKFRRRLGGRLRPDQVVYLSGVFRHDRNLHVSPSDSHWNRAGHELFARFLFGTITDLALLPSLRLRPSPEIEAWTRDERQKELASVEANDFPAYWGPQRPVESAIDTGAWTRTTAEQVYTGLSRLGGAAPYVSVLLATGGGDRLVASGKLLRGLRPSPPLVRVWVEEHELGSFRPAPGGFTQSFDLPPELREREYVNVRLTADDWTYSGANARTTVSYALQRLAIEGP